MFEIIPAHVFADFVNRFHACYADRRALFRETDTIYAIPSRVLAVVQGDSFFDKTQLELESSFTPFCEMHRYIGVRRGVPIEFDCLTNPGIDVKSVGDIAAVFGKAMGLVAEAQSKTLVSARSRMRGIAGRLLTELQFLEETRALRRRFEELPAVGRPGWPLTRALAVTAPVEGSVRAEPVVEAFSHALRKYLDRWGLMRLLDWDLPESQAPHIGSQLLIGALAEPTHGIRIIIPLHYPVRGNDDLLRQIKERQQQEMKAQGLPEHLAAIGNHEAFAQIFRLIRVETVLRSRFPEPLHRGAVGLIENAAAAELGVTPGTVRRSRTQIEKLRSGNWRPYRRGARTDWTFVRSRKNPKLRVYQKANSR